MEWSGLDGMDAIWMGWDGMGWDGVVTACDWMAWTGLTIEKRLLRVTPPMRGKEKILLLFDWTVDESCRTRDLVLFCPPTNSLTMAMGVR